MHSLRRRCREFLQPSISYPLNNRFKSRSIKKVADIHRQPGFSDPPGAVKLRRCMVSISELLTRWSGDSLIYHADFFNILHRIANPVMQNYKIFSNRQYPRLLKMLGLMMPGVMGSNPISLSSQLPLLQHLISAINQ